MWIAHFLLSPASHKKASGFSAVSQLFSERWPSIPASRGFSGPTTERNIDFELDIRVEIDSGKCVLHPTTQQVEHEDVSLRRYIDLFTRDSGRPELDLLTRSELWWS